MITKSNAKKNMRKINADNVYTGFTDLDWKTGGFERGKLITLGGRPGSGKTMFTFSCLRNLIKNGNCNILYFSTDDDKKHLSTKLVRSYSKIDIDGPSDSDKECETVKKARNILYKSGFRIFDNSKRKISPKAINRACKKYAKEHKTIDLVVISSLELVITGSDNKENTANILKHLRELARKFDCCVLLLSNLKGGIEKRDDKTPRLSDFKYKRTITTYSDRVWAFSAPDHSEQKPFSQLFFLKGNLGYINLIPLKRFGLMVTPKN